MTVYIVTAVITCVLALLFEHEECKETNFIETREMTRVHFKNKIVCAMIFFVLFAVSAGRIAVGKDYWRYTEIFDLLSQGRDKSVATEIGFNLLVKIVQALIGFDGKKYIAIFAIVAFITIYFFVRGLEDQAEFFALSFFLYMSLGYYASSFNSIRNYLAFAVAFYSVKYIFRREFWKFALIILIASTFHMTVLVVLIAYPLGLMKWKWWKAVILAAGSLSLVFFQDFYRRIVFFFYPHYENSIFDVGDFSAVNIIRCAGTLILALILYKRALKGNEKNMFYFNMNVFAAVVYCFCSFLPVVSRVGYYFNVFQIVLIPNLIKTMPKKWMRIASTAAIIVFGSIYYIYFLHMSKTDGTGLVPYLNWVTN